jgi:ADP-heptose:LPS heptosyltransferase
MSSKTEWAAIFRGGGIGDDLITTSPLPLLRAKYGKVEVLTHGAPAVVFENNPYIDKLTILPDDRPEFASSAAWQKWFKDRAVEYAFFQNLSHTVEARLVLTVAQTDFYRPDEWRRKHCGISYLENTHDACGVPHIFDPGPMFYPTEDEQRDVARLKAKIGGKVIGWVLGGSRIDKLHPLAAHCVQRLLIEFPEHSVLMFGSGQRDFDIAKRIDEHVLASNCDHSRLHLALTPGPGLPQPAASPEDAKRIAEKEDTDWPIRRSLTMAQACDVLITPDSGLAWACAMREEVGKVMLLSHASRENITKHWRRTISLQADPGRVRCAPCHKLHDDVSTCTPNKQNTGAACISDISVRDILAATASLLETQSVRMTGRNLVQFAGAASD